MSRRDKQADLRRRMAEARSKLVSSQSNARELDQGSVTAGKKRPLSASSSSGAGGGGILRKPKYSSADGAAITTTAPSKANDSSAPKKDNALGGLMAGYDDSSSDDDEGDTKAAVVPHSAINNSVANTKQSAVTPTSTALHDNNSVKFSATHKKRKGAKFEERTTIDDAESMQQKGGKLEMTTTPDSELKAGVQEKGKKSAEISDEVWDEFNALLDDDEANNSAKRSEATPPAVNNEAFKSDDIASNTLSVEEAGSSTTTNKTTKKKKKKKKVKPSTAKDMYDTEVMDNVEQASYEARLGRLMLLKSKKKQHKSDETVDDDAAVVPSTNDFYDPGLAFQQDNDEDAQDELGEERTKEDASQSKPDESGSGGGEGLLSKSVSAVGAPTPPYVSLAKILRDRRDQARQLSSRGNNSKEETGSEEFPENDVSDGCWF
mmetsp:Transcript_2655/g.5718  ORF Transcript_2655/g.5718 Transcript_2655/m.5718 type:complete len:434 (-) Transcript_2655:62-1363(-)|eukprot:CAMPEP_0172320852 /NCGR_PEP_ID=MMETSP1058-20130122/41611_1 /TAXON_ID=83371 /ORGANISM="Detonula confervacea, Strain CCMP 353" /LENGTH=433 /DNA_ID=CAMNT_0013036207 /DNA_START=208 /DNA_END=1509 /DNA_ORIENTATION=-